MKPEYRHVLIIGGTGMLAKASRALLKKSQAATLIARHANQFHIPDASNLEKINVDYTNTNDMIKTLEKRCASSPPFDLAVIWMHNKGNKTLPSLLALLNQSPVMVVHVLGSASGDPRKNNPAKKLCANLKNINYVPVVLGNISDQSTHRWLTHDEISQGVLDAVEAGTPRVVGNLIIRPVAKIQKVHLI